MWTPWNVHVRASPDGWLKDFEDTSGYYLVTAALNALACMTGNQFLSTDSRLLTESPGRLFMPMSAQCWVAVLTLSVQPHWFKKLPLPSLCKYEAHTMKAKPTWTDWRLKLCHWVLRGLGVIRFTSSTPTFPVVCGGGASLLSTLSSQAFLVLVQLCSCTVPLISNFQEAQITSWTMWWSSRLRQTRHLEQY